ncbi:hypothetical protein GBAR_LOCUS25475 [Geodia barretti]|nr:hypothetical protein GBAR_LOCUS25475 [Geodia barretti]
MATSVEEQTLSDRDVAEIVQDIFDVQNETEALGRVLKLPKATVESIHRQQHSRPKDRLFHIIDEFVKQVEPRPTWKVIANALRSPLIGQPRLALDIERKHCTNTEANAIRSLQAEDIEVAVAQYLLKEKVEQLQSENDALKQQLARKEIELMRAEETVRKEQQAIQEMRQRETELVQAKDREIAKIQGLMKHMEQQIQKMEQIETVSVDAKDKELSETQKEPSQEGDNECGFLVTESLQQSGTEAETENQSETAMCQSLNLGVKLTEDAEPPLTQENEWFTRDQEHLQPKEQETESGSSEPAKSQEKENTIKTLVAENLQEIEPTMEEAEQSSFYTCKVSGPGLTSATVNEPTHILVELTDSHGRPLPLQHNVTVKLELVPNAKYPTPETTLTRWSKKPPEMSVSVDMISTFQYK